MGCILRVRKIFAAQDAVKESAIRRTGRCYCLRHTPGMGVNGCVFGCGDWLSLLTAQAGDRCRLEGLAATAATKALHAAGLPMSNY